MPAAISLTSVDWAALTTYRAKAADAGWDPAVITTLAATATPVVSDLERARLTAAEQAGTPFGAIVSLKLRAEPASAAAVADWVRNHAPNLVDDLLIELARTGPWQQLEIETDLLLAYYSQAYRLIVTGRAGSEVDDARRYDGDLTLLAATGERLYPDPPDVILYSAARVDELAHTLRTLVPAPSAVGDIGPLYDLWDDFYDPSISLDDVARRSLDWLAALYANAASRGEGLKLIS